VLSEAKRVRDRFGSELSAIYVGECSDETVKKFREVFAQLKLPEDSRVFYQRGEDPAGGILQALTDNNIDMIVAGALEKEVVLRPFLGNVARRLVREAKCSVMLFTKPDAEPQPLKRIVFMVDYSEHAQRAFRSTLRLAAAENCERLYAIRVYTTFDEARAAISAENKESGLRARTFEEEEKALEEFILDAGQTGVPIEARCVRGNTGFAASDFVQSVDADLLVVPIHPNDDPREPLPNHIAWITDVIPCNLWVIR
jgi:nucleotide-binding universal stress UspA family protein